MTNPVRELLLGPRPAVIACLTTPEHLNRLPEIKAAGADLAEFRADHFMPEMNEVDFCCCLETIRSIMPVIFTLRSRDEGGESELYDEERHLIASSLLGHMDALDVQTEDAHAKRMVAEAKEKGVFTIASQHFLDDMPHNEMFEIAIRAGQQTEAEMVKLACRLNNTGSMNRLGRYMLTVGRRGYMFMGMGEAYGAQSRLLAIGTGTPGVYATPETDASKAAVPGQLTVELARRVIDAAYPLDASS